MLETYFFFLTFPLFFLLSYTFFSPFFQTSQLQEFDLDAFSSAQFQDAITQRRKAEDLSAVLYPNVPWRRRRATRLGMIHQVKL